MKSINPNLYSAQDRLCNRLPVTIAITANPLKGMLPPAARNQYCFIKSDGRYFYHHFPFDMELPNPFLLILKWVTGNFGRKNTATTDIHN